MKKCSKCGVEKDESEFGKDVRHKDGLQGSCKLCVAKIKQDWAENNPEKVIKSAKEWNEKNPEEAKIRAKEWRKNNPEYDKEHSKQYRESNPEYMKEYFKNRRKNDPLFKLSGNIRNLINVVFKNSGYKKSSRTSAILGCTYEEFQLHIEKQFADGMHWGNQGKWHLDHIYPVSRAVDEQHLLQLNHYTNFQPLWAEENLKKGNKIFDNIS
ncbi:MAG: hypothetical protein PHG08_00460 [Bacilli bacterium]|nr:hypothetical protein [Bacilli bacterium]